MTRPPHLCTLLLVVLPACTTTTRARDLTRPKAAQWLDEHRGDHVGILGRPDGQPRAFGIGTVLGLIAGNGEDLEIGEPPP